MQARTERVALRHAAAEPRLARLREPTGGDELAVGGIDTRSCVALLDRIVEGAPCPAADLSASDRDGLLAALHRALWGDRVVSTLRCEACGEPYDLAFELSWLQRALLAQCDRGRVAAPRTIEAADGARFTLPSAEEEDAAAALGPAAGRAQLVAAITGGDGADTDIAARLDALAPLIDVDLDTSCAECGHAALARFDIQSFVLQRLLDERDGVLGEVHALAASYGWALAEILSLPRALRRSLVERIGATPAPFG